MQVVGALLLVAAPDTRFINIVDSNFSGSMNQLPIVQQNANMRNSTIGLIKKSQIAANRIV